ncbi:MAG: hypothetical protein R3202_02480 [Candidatus Competibacterales bacterium]|nr:hypothetical protein [Candidatus Competibacterales bacterium]
MAEGPGGSAVRRRRWSKLALLIGSLVLLHQAGLWLLESLEFWLGHSDPWLARWADLIYALAFLLYALLLSIPFVPGVELGWVLMMLLGPRGVVGVYLATVGGLLLSFWAGRAIPLLACGRLLEWLHLGRAAQFIARLQPLDADQRLRLLVLRAPVRIVPFLLRHRYLALAVAFNLPGNTLLGGGGGIALVAGMSGLFAPLRYTLVLVLAVSPVPLLLLTGHSLELLPTWLRVV